MQIKMRKRSIMVFVIRLLVAAFLPITEFGKTVSADTAVKRIFSARAKIGTIQKGAMQEFEVATSTDIKYLMLYAEDGKTLVKTWTASNSVVSGSTRTWTVRQAIQTPGDRKLVFKGGVTSPAPVTNSVTCAFKVTNTGVISGAARYAAIKKGGVQEFSIGTSTDAKYLMEYAEDGKLVKTWTDSSVQTSVSGNVKAWNITQNINTAGKRSLVFKAGSTSTPTSDKVTIKFTVEETWVNEAAVKYATINKGGTRTFTVKTPKNAQYLMLYAEEGTLVKTWPASGNSTVSGDVRTWTVNLAINTGGNRQLTLKAGTSTTPSSLGKTVKFLVAEKKIVSAKAANSVIKVGGAQQFTVVTSIDVKYLMLYAEDGNRVAGWDSSYSTEDSSKTRTWKVSRNIATAGARKLVFKGGSTNTTAVTNALTVAFKVEDTWVNSATVGYTLIGTGGTQTFKVSTTKGAQYLMLYGEGGNLVKTWPASGNSTVSGDDRIWNVSLAINTTGSRKLTLKAGKTSTASSYSKTAEFNVVEKMVLGATMQYSTLTRTMTPKFQVITSADVKYLMLYSRDGSTVYITWDATGYSTSDSTNIRIWTLELPNDHAGTFLFTFKGGTAKKTTNTNGYNISYEVVDSGLLSAFANYDSVKMGQAQRFTILTTTSDNTLELCTKSGVKLKSWTATSQNSSDKDGVRTWNVSYYFDSAGTKNLIFRVQTYSSLPASEHAVSFKVTSDVMINTVTFPDKVFREYVSEEFDEDKDGILNATEINKAEKIDLCYAECKSLEGVKYFPELEQIYCGYNGMGQLDVSKNTNLRRLDCNANDLTSLDVSNNTKLTVLNVFGNELTSIDIRKNTLLTSFDCGLNNLTSLDVSKNTELKFLSCDRNSLSTLDLSKNTKLETLRCGENQLKVLDLSHNTELNVLSCYENMLTALDLSNIPKLHSLACSKNYLSELDVSNNWELADLYCYNNELGVLNLSSNPELVYLYCDHTNITQLNVSRNTKLKYIRCNIDVEVIGAKDGVNIVREK